MTAYIQVSAIIDCAIELVFDKSMNDDLIPQWSPGLLEAHSDGPPGVGTTTTEVRRFLGIRMVNRLECVEYDRPYRAVYEVSDEIAPHTITHDYEKIDGGTKLTITVTGEVKGVLAKIGERIVVAKLESNLNQGLQNLKNMLESSCQ